MVVVRVFWGVNLLTLKSELQKVNYLFLWVLNGCEWMKNTSNKQRWEEWKTAETLIWNPMWTASDQCPLLYILRDFELSYFTYSLKDFSDSEISFSLKFLSVLYCFVTKFRGINKLCSSIFIWEGKFCNIDTYYIGPNSKS